MYFRVKQGSHFRVLNKIKHILYVNKININATFTSWDIYHHQNNKTLIENFGLFMASSFWDVVQVK